MKKLMTLAAVALMCSVAFAQDNSLEFTSSGSFTVPNGVTSLTIEVIGAGGTGGGNGGGGGGGGAYASGVYTVNPGDVLTVTVGTGGSGAAVGTSSVGSFLSATGGENGTSVPNPNLGGGGAGGSATGGNIANRSGGNGGGGYWTYFGGGGGGAAGSITNGSNGGNTIVWNGNNCLTPGGDGGISGGAPGGNGGKGAGFTDNFCNITNPAAGGGNYGAGGGGGNGNGGSPGAGANGYCLISWGFGTYTQGAFVNASATVFPNVFANQISVQNENGKEFYELISSTGQSVWSGRHIEQQDFSHLPSGLYLLKINTVSSMKNVKLIKQ